MWFFVFFVTHRIINKKKIKMAAASARKESEESKKPDPWWFLQKEEKDLNEEDDDDGFHAYDINDPYDEYGDEGGDDDDAVNGEMGATFHSRVFPHTSMAAVLGTAHTFLPFLIVPGTVFVSLFSCCLNS